MRGNTARVIFAGMTQENKQTAERWNWRGPWRSNAETIEDIELTCFAHALHPSEDKAWDAAAAARIVACVNACEGMADPAVEIAALRARVAELENEAGHE